jgi:hypothetical protein
MAQTKKKYSYEVRTSMLNARNKAARARARTVTGPLVWCQGDVTEGKPHNTAKCPRCGPRQGYHFNGIVNEFKQKGDEGYRSRFKKGGKAA